MDFIEHPDLAIERARAHRRLTELGVPEVDDRGRPLGLVLRISVLADQQQGAVDAMRALPVASIKKALAYADLDAPELIEPLDAIDAYLSGGQ